MRMEDVLSAIGPATVVQGKPGLEFSGVSCDSRKVLPGHLFAALPGAKSDGAEYASEAEKKGAAAIIASNEKPLCGLPQIAAPDPRAALARAARLFYGTPDKRLRVGAITGTNGKSTTAYLVRHILKSCATPCGMMGTIEYDLGAHSIPAPLTTPESVDVYANLRAMLDCGSQAAIMEVSSHALCQSRVEGLDFAAAGFTNLTQDHLDYHRTMEAYREAKGRLFASLSAKATAVLNIDDPAGVYYAKLTKAQVLGCSQKNNKKAELRAQLKSMDIHGTTFKIDSPWGKRELRWGLVGEHNLQNALCALGLALVLGDSAARTFRFDAALSALERFKGTPGRLESVGDDLAGTPYRVLVDYAHTDDALRNVLQALRMLKPNRVIAVFGCGGDRDRTKRPKMGRAVEELADMGIVTSDNPRTEDPRFIIGQIWEGISRKQKFTMEIDRAKAIDLAIREARPGDVIVIAGKGHEDYQIVGAEKRHFDDREEARAAMLRRIGRDSSAAAS